MNNGKNGTKPKKKDSFFTLAPERVQYEQFWVEIRKRNLWLIVFRYIAIGIITLSLSFLVVFQHFTRTIYINTLPLWFIDFSILFYNLAFHRIWHLMPKIQESIKVNNLHLSLIQIISDWLALSLIIYFLGGDETPIYAFFIFHVIIGSLFLTGTIIRLIVSFFYILTLTGALLELQGKIPHHSIIGLYQTPLYNNVWYVGIFFILFGIILYFSIYFANSIARELYLQGRSLSFANRKLEEAEKAKSRYVMSVVHDLKTPIISAINYLNLLLEGTLGDVKQNQLRPIERSRIRLNNAISMINDILQISQLQVEESFDNITEVYIVKLFDEIYNDFRQMMNIKRLNYYFETDSKDGAKIQGEPKLLRLAFSNLISNACKYTDINGEIVVKIEDADDYINISVADNGIGIPENEKDKIFRDFYRSTISKEKGFEGTGLGMSIVLNIIQKHHGEITVNSPSSLKNGDDKPGTEFIAKLPKKYVIE